MQLLFSVFLPDGCLLSHCGNITNILIFFFSQLPMTVHIFEYKKTDFVSIYNITKQVKFFIP